MVTSTTLWHTTAEGLIYSCIYIFFQYAWCLAGFVGACSIVVFSYKRSASLSQFVIHRGLIISSMQAVFSAVFYFASIALFPGFLMVGLVLWNSATSIYYLRH